jgi:hypothetical protein
MFRAKTLASLLLAAALTSACLGTRATVAPLPTAALPTSTVAPSETPFVSPTPAPPTAEPASATPAATETPEATPTPSAVPATATATVPPTPDPNEGVGAVVYADPLDGSSQWFWGYQDEVVRFEIADQRVLATMSQANAGWRFTSSDDSLRITDQQARVTAHTLACAENDEYGLLFRLTSTFTATEAPAPEYAGYLLKLRCSGAARLDLVRGSSSAPVFDWQPSDAIQAGVPATNVLMVWARGSEMRFYVNDEYLFTATEASQATGFYGLYVYDRTAGGLQVAFEDLEVRAVGP